MRARQKKSLFSVRNNLSVFLILPLLYFLYRIIFSDFSPENVSALVCRHEYISETKPAEGHSVLKIHADLDFFVNSFYQSPAVLRLNKALREAFPVLTKKIIEHLVFYSNPVSDRAPPR